MSLLEIKNKYHANIQKMQDT